jgi:hypothetical protein
MFDWIPFIGDWPLLIQISIVLGYLSVLAIALVDIGGLFQRTSLSYETTWLTQVAALSVGIVSLVAGYIGAAATLDGSQDITAALLYLLPLAFLIFATKAFIEDYSLSLSGITASVAALALFGILINTTILVVLVATLFVAFALFWMGSILLALLTE